MSDQRLSKLQREILENCLIIQKRDKKNYVWCWEILRGIAIKHDIAPHENSEGVICYRDFSLESSFSK